MSRFASQRFMVVLSLVVASVAVLAGPAGAGTNTTFSGRATAVKGTVLGLPITLVDTGPVAAGGGDLEANLLCYPTGNNCTIGGLPDVTNGALSAQVLHAAVVAHGNKSRAEASTAELNLVNVAGNSIGVEFLQARAEATCADGKASVSGKAEVLGLTINGQTIAVTGEVGQMIPLPGGGFVVVNEQIASAAADNGDITVNALHVVIPGLIPGFDTDLIVAQAHADILCGTGQPGCSGPDKVTGGGYVLNGAARRNFAVAGRQLSAWGHFLFTDHATGDRMKATVVDPMTFDADGFAVISGIAEVNGSGAYSFTVKLKDNGEPGRNDQFALTTSYASLNQPVTTLSGGNIQFHKPCK